MTTLRAKKTRRSVESCLAAQGSFGTDRGRRREDGPSTPLGGRHGQVRCAGLGRLPSARADPLRIGVHDPESDRGEDPVPLPDDPERVLPRRRARRWDGRTGGSSALRHRGAVPSSGLPRPVHGNRRDGAGEPDRFLASRSRKVRNARRDPRVRGGFLPPDVARRPGRVRSGIPARDHRVPLRRFAQAASGRGGYGRSSRARTDVTSGRRIFHGFCTRCRSRHRPEAGRRRSACLFPRAVRARRPALPRRQLAWAASESHGGADAGGRGGGMGRAADPLLGRGLDRSAPARRGESRTTDRRRGGRGDRLRLHERELL